ncbi:MAG: hemolysin family protein [Alistipes sp.]|nr:hemolysin family protein [Alistipes sp.]
MFSVAVIIITTLVFSAFFSGMEIAFVSSNKLKLEIEKKKSRSYNHIIDVFLKDPGQYITTILVGNNIALVIYSMSMSTLLNHLAARYGIDTGQSSVLVETLISTVVIIFTAEFVPKAMFRGNPNFFLKLFAVPVYLFYLILYPIAKFTTWLAQIILRLFGLNVRPGQTIKGFDRVDLEHLLEESNPNEQQESEENEIKLLRNALDFSDLLVRDCMVHRVDIEAVDILCSIEELTRKFIDTHYSRIFVYDGSIDNIIGYVNTKSLFTSPASIQEVLMDVDFVPESLSAQKLLSKLIKNKRAIAVVIDEYGGTAGIVSMEDVLEEIFGEIEDEHDAPDLVEKVTPSGEYILSCRLEVDYLNQKYALGIPESDEYDTLAGYIIYFYESIPARGELITRDGLEIRILRTNGSKLELARISKQ